MAPITRRDWPEMRDEVRRRLGITTVGGSNLDARIEQTMTSAYYDLALTFHHYELHELVFDTLDATFNTTPLPEDVYLVISVGLLAQGGDQTWINVTHSDLRTVSPVDNSNPEPRQPTEYARTFDTNVVTPEHILWFDTPSDQDYNVQIRYYRRPRAPDFASSDNSELDWLWDEFILQRTLALMFPQTWRFDMAQVPMATLMEWYQRQVQAPLKTGIRDYPERNLADAALGGEQ